MTRFRTTRWSLVSAAAGATRAALGELCALYWPPVYTFIRRSGHGADDALDLTQGFFARLLERNDLADVDRARGRFRAWLLGTLKHFLANERRRDDARKRGGGAVVISIDASDAEGRYACEPADARTPEDAYQRRWAMTVLTRVIEDLDREYAGDRVRFERMWPFVTGDEPSYDALARELGEAPGALRVQVHRLRRRYRDGLRHEIGRTVAGRAEIDQELTHLFTVL